MKKLMFLMMALLVAPAMAAVTISLVDVPGECAVDLVVTADGADTFVDTDTVTNSLVAGIALNVSVGAGEEITSVTGFMDSGESVDGAEGYGIYMGTITFLVTDPDGIPDSGDEITTIDAVGTPVAPASAPDAPGQLPGESCVLEFAALYDVGNTGNAPDSVNAPLAETTLCRINLSGDATVTVTEEIATRGGIVNIGGTAPSSVVMPAPTMVSCGPPCWTSCQPFGDANSDGLISALDVQVLLGAWGQAYDPCVDFNRDGLVSALDVQVLLGTWGGTCP
ncbi:MAG: hypothetical protein J7M40_10275 [Planctomycetes bacterium]|nr:hypothetical protein [Planctomycetota bacterium]